MLLVIGVATADLALEQAMQSLQIERQADQTPFAGDGQPPRSENWRKPSTSLMIPITGSTVHLRKP